MTEIKLGTIGSGNIVHWVLDNVKYADGIRITAMYSRNRDTAAALAAEYGADRCYSDMDAFLADGEINTVYIATPNLLHYEQARKALLAGKHVILEKPFTTTSQQAKELIAIAKQRKLFLIEAVPTGFMPNFALLKEQLPKIGNVKLIQNNFSQYSSRYDKFVAGELPNIFNPAYAGGSLMDINFYNIFMNIALFGKPQDAAYYPNMFRGIDTSGIAVLRYDGFVSECTGAKDTWGKNFMMIEGDRGYIYVEDGSNVSSVEVVTKQTREVFNEQPNTNRWYYEVQNLTRMLLDEDLAGAEKRLDITLAVVETIETMRRKAGIVFPNDSFGE